ncbi:ricin-type beta-trefoil lectin domain protein [Streptomyces sp. NPDC060205]|uniref:ricin-type beta-trefoil lectin domain protein n=2 Tax=Streptomyces TaxID=1883 RepID=UPI003646CDFB
MARGEGDDDRPGAGVHTGASDARLTELLRADAATADAALEELRARHRPAVLAYARLCTTGEYAARELTAHAFTLAARETERGTDPRGPWRHQLLLLAWRLAATWAGDQRSRRLDPALLARLHEAGPGGPTPPMLDAFHSLPTRVQGLIWYGLVEREPEDETAGLLGVTRQDVTYGLESSLQALRATFLKSHLAASGDPRCQDFRRLIEESVRPDHPRHSADLRAHLAECGHCATAYEVLSALRDDRRTALAEGLLPWGGSAYAATSGTRPHTHERTDPGPWTALSTWPPSRRFVLTSAALGVTLAPLLLFLIPSQDVDGTAAPARPPVTVTATVPTEPPSSPPSKPTPSPSASPTKSPPPSPSPSPRPSHTKPPPSPPGGSYTQVVNLASGRCLDIDNGDLEKGTDVITAPCSSSRTQRWRVDADEGALRSYADPDFCLDSRGATDDGVGIWECDSLNGHNGPNLRFAVTTKGAIRPAIAPDHALTPTGNNTLDLAPDTGEAIQRWRAGRT